MKHYLIILPFLLFLSGCTPSFNCSVPDITPSQHKINADLKEVTLFYGKSDEPISEFQIKSVDLKDEDHSHHIISAWLVSLCKALKQLQLFDKSSEKKVKLLVTVQEIDSPLFGLDMNTYVLAHYKLIDIENGKNLYVDVVESSGTTPLTHSFFGYKRAEESINRAVRKNISTFITHLKNYKPRKLK